MKKTITIVFLIGVFILLSAVASKPAFAQVDIPPTPTVPVSQSVFTARTGENIYTFDELGYSDEILNGPYDSTRFRFRLPNAWELTSGVSVQLHVKNAVPVSNGQYLQSISNSTGVRLDIEFNGVVVDSLIIDWIGEHQVTLQIPLAAILEGGEEHSLDIIMDASLDCERDHNTGLIVYSDSNFDLVHNVVTPNIDLTTIPGPLYRADRLIPKNPEGIQEPLSTYLVFPDQPSSGELHAALTVSAGLAQLTSGNLPIVAVQEQDLLPEMRSSSNLIFVGLGENLTTIGEVVLPAPYQGGSYQAEGISPDDGLIQAAVSPWNPEGIIVVVSGQNDAGIVKAGQAFSTGLIRVSSRNDLAIVTEVDEQPQVTTVPTDRTLADLGYPTVQMGASVFSPNSYLDVDFFIPSGQTVVGPAYFEVYYSISPLVDYEASGLTVYLNSTPIGGVVYEETIGDEVASARISIPGHLLNPGENRLTIRANNVPEWVCSVPSTENIWAMVYDNSTIHIPLAPSEEQEIRNPKLNQFFEVLTASPTLDNVHFIVSPETPSAIVAASKIAFELGNRMTGNIVDLGAVFADELPEGYEENANLVIVGAASRIPLLGELSEYLPAPFVEGSNVADESVFQVTYRLPEGVSLGYLELLVSPWNQESIIVAVLGTTEEGIGYAGDAMSVSAIRSRLSGDFSVVRGEQVVSSDSRLGIGTGNLAATLEPDVEPEVIPGTGDDSSTAVPWIYQRWWLIPAIGVTVFLGIVVIAVAIINSRKK